MLALLLTASLALAGQRPDAAGLDSRLNLHNHSYCSDGSDTPEQFIEAAKRAGIAVVSLTDHDTVACLARSAKAAREAGLRLVPGVEISVEDDSIHMLGLNIDPENAGLRQLLARNAKARLVRALETIAKLNTLAANGRPMKLELKEVLAYKLNARRRAERLPPVEPASMTEEKLLAEIGIITRPDIAMTLVQKGYVPSANAAFSQFLGDEGEAAAELDGPSFAEAIRVIHGAGGLAVLAHPHTIYKFKQKPYSYSGKTYRDFDALLEDLLAAGLDGVEQYKNSKGPADFIVAHARDFSARAGRPVLLTPGSDYHGSSGVGQPNLASIAIPRPEAETILKLMESPGGGTRGAPSRESLVAGDAGRIERVIERNLDLQPFGRPPLRD